MTTKKIDISTPEWAIPLLAASRYKGAKGGRSSGKSHFMCERLVELHVADPNFSSVCIREIQKSLRFSAKRLIEKKIRDMGVSHLFEITMTEIRRIGGTGIIIFQGMQDHTAESIKSLEDFDLALVEEAHNLSQRSLDLLLPTIRNVNSEIWFIWNPDQPDDPVDNFLVSNCPDDAIVIHVNYKENPFLPEVSRETAEAWQKRDPDSYAHVWLGAYNTKADNQILAGRWRVDDFEPMEDWDGPYYGGDWGFSVDPCTLMQCWIFEDKLYIYSELYEHGVETDHLPAFYDRDKNAKDYVIRADNARPENVSYLARHGYHRIQSGKKWDGSVKDGISKLRSFDEIVIHTSCTHTIEEARLWRYKTDRLTGDILPIPIDKHNHCWDAIRYALEPMIKPPRDVRVYIAPGPDSHPYDNYYASLVR